MTVKTSETTKKLRSGIPERKGRGSTHKISYAQHTREINALMSRYKDEKKEWEERAEIEKCYASFVMMLVKTLKDEHDYTKE